MAKQFEDESEFDIYNSKVCSQRCVTCKRGSSE